MVKKFVTWLFMLFIISIALALVVPSFINWDNHKDVVISQILKYTKDDVSIKVSGSVDFRLLPRPGLFMNDVDIMKGENKNSIVHLEQISAIVKFKPLLEGIIEFYALELNKPTIKLEVDKEGQIANFNIFKESSRKTLGGTGRNIYINKINIVDGAIEYSNPNKDIDLLMNKINLEIAADNIVGPYEMKGKAAYNGADLNLYIKTGKYQTDSPVTLNINLLPINQDSNFPVIKYMGVVDLDNELAAQGEISIEDGKIFSILTGDKLKNIAFLHDKIRAQALFKANLSEIAFNQIKLKANEHTSVEGDMSFDISKLDKSYMKANFDVKNLTLINRILSTYIYAPDNMSGDIGIKGSNLVIGGENVKYADMNISFNNNKWNIKSSELYMRGDSKINFSGAVKPEGDSVYNFKLESKKPDELLSNLPTDQGGLLMAIAKSPLMKDIKLNGKMYSNKSQLILKEIVLTAPTAKIAGELNIGDDGKSYANLNISELNIDEKSSKDISALLKTISKFNTKVNLAGTNISNGGVTLKDVSLKASTLNNVTQIEQMNATIGDNDIFAIIGSIDNNAGKENLNIEFSAEAGQPQKIAEFFGVNIPMLKILKESSNIKGKIKGNAEKYDFDIDGEFKGGNVSITGISADKGKNYSADIKVKTDKKASEILNALSIPANSILPEGNSLNLTGKVSGNNKIYKIDAIQAEVGSTKFAGSINKTAKGIDAKIIAEDLNIDKFIKSDISKNLSNGLKIDISAQSNSWGGTFKATLEAKDENSAVIKGKIVSADLNSALRETGIKNYLYFANGDIDFDILKTGKKITGDAVIKTPNFEVPQLNYNNLGSVINELNKVPDDLTREIDIELKKGKIIFKDIEIPLVIDGETVSIKDPILHESENGKVTIDKASCNLSTNKYNIITKFEIMKPKTLPKFKIEFSEKDDINIVGLDDLKEFIKKNNPPPLKVLKNIYDIPQAAKAQDPTAAPDGQFEVEELKTLAPEQQPVKTEEQSEPAANDNKAIDDILNRLEK